MLEEEIERASRQVRTDAYQMSIGEIVNMYKDGELVINPDFQRLFRWEAGQKSKLIESILLGIPLPSIFVFEKNDAKWELIDGLQRISTLLEFMGLLRGPDGERLPPSVLTATKYLPSLDKVVWETSQEITEPTEDQQVPISSAYQLAIRRARLSVEILKRPSDNATKYDLFQRLNAGGMPANSQEIRNCIMIMINEQYSRFVRHLADYNSFRIVLSASDDQIEKQRHMEYVSRFLVLTYVPYDSKLDVEEFIDEGIVTLAEAGEVHSAETTFKGTFDLLNEVLGADALRRVQNGHPTGRVGLAAFECIAVGIGRNFNNVASKPNPMDYVRTRITEFWASPNLEQIFSPGLRGTTRIQRTIQLGSQWFST